MILGTLHHHGSIRGFSMDLQCNIMIMLRHLQNIQTRHKLALTMMWNFVLFENLKLTNKNQCIYVSSVNHQNN